MLVVTRKECEKLVLRIGEVRIEVVVSKVRGKRVSIGIAAPREVDVVRGEAESKQ